MTEVNILKCEVRKNTGKSFSKLVRKEGNIPCIIYGDKKDPIAININSSAALKLYNTGRMLTTLLDLELSNGDKLKAIPKDIQIDPVKDNIIHIDLLRLSGDSRVAVEIQVNFVGESNSPGIKKGGVLNVTRYSVELDCPALSIPEKIDVDISNLEIGGSVKLSDVTLPADVNPVITDRDITIASLTARAEEIEEEVVEEIDEEGEASSDTDAVPEAESTSSENNQDNEQDLSLIHI